MTFCIFTVGIEPLPTLMAGEAAGARDAVEGFAPPMFAGAAAAFTPVEGGAGVGVAG